MDKEKKMEQNEDEISLVDLLVVLLKHWKMIVVLPVVVVIILSTYLFLKPKQIKDRKTETYVTLTVNPLIKQFSGLVNLEDLISNFYLKDLDLIYKAVQDSRINKIYNIDLPVKSEESIFTVKSLIIDGKTPQNKILQDSDKPLFVENKNGVITIIVRFNDIEQSLKFLEQVTFSVKTKVNELLLPIARKEVEDYERLMSEGSKSASNLLQNSLAVRYPTYSSAQRYLLGNQIPLIISNPISVEPPAPSNNSKTILFVAFFAALFFAIFLAFVLEAIENIRKDPEAMAKIRSALKKDSQ